MLFIFKYRKRYTKCIWLTRTLKYLHTRMHEIYVQILVISMKLMWLSRTFKMPAHGMHMIYAIELTETGLDGNYLKLYKTQLIYPQECWCTCGIFTCTGITALGESEIKQNYTQVSSSECYRELSRLLPFWDKRILRLRLNYFSYPWWLFLRKKNRMCRIMVNIIISSNRFI